MSEKNKKSDIALMSIIVLLVVMILFLVTGIVRQLIPKMKTANILETAAIHAKANNSEAQVLETLDGWGNNLILTKEVNDMYIVYVTFSSGKDGVFETDDDMYHKVTDLNKSRIVGKFLAVKSKELWVGAKEGWKEESKFSGGDNEIK